MLLRTSHTLLPNRCAPRAQRLFVPHVARSLASTRAGPDKSWGEILGSAADLAKDVVSKVKDSVGQALAPKDKAKPSNKLVQQPKQQQSILPDRPGVFGGGLLGRAIGGLVASAVNQIGQQMEKAAQESKGEYDKAASRIMASSKLRSAMGEVRVGPIMSQSMSSSSINGVTSKNISIIFPVYAALGDTAQAQVIFQGSGKSSRSDITVRLPNGTLVKIDGAGGDGPAGADGETIDVEFTDVR